MVNNLKKQPGTILFATLVLLNSAWIFHTYLAVTQLGTFGPASLAGALAGTAERPYVYRVLVPILAKTLAPLFPLHLAEKLADAPASISRAFEALSSGGYPREAAIVLMLMFCSLAGFAYAQKSLIEKLGGRGRELLILPLLSQILILPFTIFFAYYYDLPQLLLVTLCLNFLVEGKWLTYLSLFGLASLNKETSLLLIAVFAVYYFSNLPRKTFLRLLFMQVLIYASIRSVLLLAYHDNPGATVYLNLKLHYDQYRAYPPSLWFTLAYFAGLGFLMLKNWKHKHAFLRAGSVMTAGILVLFFTSGLPFEFRVFLEALPIMVLSMYPFSLGGEQV